MLMKTDGNKLVNKSSTVFLKLILYALSLGALAIAFFLIYITAKSDLVGGYEPILIGVSILSSLISSRVDPDPPWKTKSMWLCPTL